MKQAIKTGSNHSKVSIVKIVEKFNINLAV